MVVLDIRLPCADDSHFVATCRRPDLPPLVYSLGASECAGESDPVEVLRALLEGRPDEVVSLVSQLVARNTELEHRLAQLMGGAEERGH